SESSRNALSCIICLRDLSSGLFQLEEHPIVPEVAVCLRCFEMVGREAIADDDEDTCCACCTETESDEVQFSRCDERDCRRAFCNVCLDKLGEGTAMTLASSDKAWQCLCCDQSQLSSLQASLKTLFAEAKRHPPPITKVLARLAEESEAEGEGVSGSPSPLQPGEEVDDEELDQQLVDALNVVEDEISEAQAQTENGAIEKLTEDILEELSGENPKMTQEQLDDVVRSEVEKVTELWQDRLDAANDIQPTLLEALEVRGLSAAAVFLKRGAARAGQGAAAAEGVAGGGAGFGGGADDVGDDDEEEDDHDGKLEGNILPHLYAAAGGAPESVDVLLSKGENLLKDLPRQTRIQSLAEDFFERTFRAVNGTTDDNGIRRSGVGLWGPKRIAAAAKQTVEFFREEQTENGRPSTEDVEAWGLHGDAAELLAMLLRWIRSRLATKDGTTAAPSSFSGAEGEDDDQQLPPLDRQGLVFECKDMTRRIKADDATATPEISGMGEDLEAFWQSASIVVLSDNWHRLRTQLKKAESEVAVDVEDLGPGTSTVAYLKSSRRVFNYTPEEAAHKLEEATASDGLPATRLRDEDTDSAAVNRERRGAVFAGSQPRRPCPPLARKTAGDAASSNLSSGLNANPSSLSSGAGISPTQRATENNSAAECRGRAGAGKAVDASCVGSTVGEPAPGVAGQAVAPSAAITTTSTTVAGDDDGNDIVDASELEAERVRQLEPQPTAEMNVSVGTTPGGIQEGEGRESSGGGGGGGGDGDGDGHGDGDGDGDGSSREHDADSDADSDAGSVASTVLDEPWSRPGEGGQDEVDNIKSNGLDAPGVIDLTQSDGKEEGEPGDTPDVIDLTDEIGPEGVEKMTSDARGGNRSAEVQHPAPRGRGEGGSAEADAGQHDRCRKERRKRDPSALLGLTNSLPPGCRGVFESPPPATDVSQGRAGILPVRRTGGNVESLSLSEFWVSGEYADGETGVRSAAGSTARRTQDRSKMDRSSRPRPGRSCEVAPFHGGGLSLQHQMAAEHENMSLEDMLLSEEEPVDASSTHKRNYAKQDGQENKRQKTQNLLPWW
ncbi:unnamed protein product, partial [Ectocarpus fasciculatus]